MIARVKNFKIGLCRGRREGPVRTMDLFVESEHDPALHRVFIHFMEKKPSDMGFVNRVNESVVVFLPVSDFELAKELLSGPTGIFFAWTEDSDGALVWAELTTAEEPLRAAPHAEQLGVNG